MHDSAQIYHGGKSPARGVGGKLPARGVDEKSPAWAGKSALAGNMPDSTQLCHGRFTNSAPADVIVAALVGFECYQPGLLQYSSQSGFNLLLHFLPSAGNSAKTQETTALLDSVHRQLVHSLYTWFYLLCSFAFFGEIIFQSLKQKCTYLKLCSTEFAKVSSAMSSPQDLDDKGDVLAETTGPAPAEVSAGIQISAERLLCYWLIPKSE
ncbi:hypothetical protein V6N13_006151 [Hibiscus sabdariffa]